MSITSGNRLAFLSGLTGVPAYQHLRQIAGFYGVAAAMLVAFSGYQTAPGWVHLFPPESTESASGGARSRSDSDSDWDLVSPHSKKRSAAQIVAAHPSLSEVERRVLDASLQAFLSAGATEDSPDGRAAIKAFVDKTVERMARAELARRVETEKIASDFFDAAAQQKAENRRRAIILVILMFFFA